MSAPSFDMPLILAVGVTGHRTLAQPETVRRQLDTVLAEIRSSIARLAGTASAELRVISPLAEGADRLFAEAGLAAGGVLHAPLPFARAEYLADFAAPASRQAFADLLARADRVLELDGDPRQRDLAYLEVGRVVTTYSDILVAVWDGEPGRGLGGTAEIVAEALKDGVTVVGVDPQGRRPPGLLRGSIHQPHWDDLGGLAACIHALLTPPPGGKHSAGLGEFARTSAAVPDAFEASRAQWAALFPRESTLAAICAPCMAGPPTEAFARADTLASRYASRYRHAFVVNFVLSAVAVGLALLGERIHPVAFRVAEIVSIVVIVALTGIANGLNWHQRWIEYRHLAEQLRPLRFLFPLALALPKSHTGRPLQADEHLTAWADWLVRRVEITLGFPSTEFAPDYLTGVRDFVIKDILEEQICYHRRKAKRMRGLDSLFHTFGTILFGFTAVACVFDIIDLVNPGAGGWLATLHHWQPVVIFAAGVAPAFGAALLGIRNIGEYDRLERRSSAMAAALDQTRADLTHEDGRRLRRGRLAQHLEAIAAQMVSETADWRTLVITRRIEWPG